MRTFVLGVALIPLLVVVLPTCLYLGLLTVLAPFGMARSVVQPSGRRRFLVLIPAHDEEMVIGRLLQCLAHVDYPPELLEICVVADNCADATAGMARIHGADVFVRHNDEQIGKGFALQWLLGELRRAGRKADAYVILDADSRVSLNFFRVMNAHLSAGAAVVQAYYTVLPVRGTRAESLREAALALVHFLRPAAKAAIGASCGLKGNGMCFATTVIERFGWPTAGLAEDVEYHLTLVGAGIRVRFAPRARVLGEMPSSMRRGQSQNRRWEAGRLTTLRSLAWPLLTRGIRTRDVAMVDAAFEQFVPPLSVPVAIACLVLAISLTLGSWVAWLAGGMLAVLVLYVVVGLALARVGPNVYRSLFYAPAYMSWKVLLYAKVLVGPRQRRWVRTERATDP